MDKLLLINGGKVAAECLIRDIKIYLGTYFQIWNDLDEKDGLRFSNSERDNLLLKQIADVISHEHIHKIINKIENGLTSHIYDGIYDLVESESSCHRWQTSPTTETEN